MFVSLKIGTRLMIGFGMVILIGMISTLINSHSFKMVHVAARQVRDVNLPYAILAADMAFDTVQVQQFLTDVSATHNPDGYKDAEQAAVHFRKGIASFREQYRQLGDAKTLAELDELEKLFERYNTEGRRMAEAYVSQGMEAGNKIMEDFDKTSLSLAGKMGDFKKRQAEAANASLDAVDASLRWSRTLLWGLAGVVIVLSLLISVLIARSITRPLQAMLAMLMDIAKGEGDLTKRLSYRGKDELGEVCSWFNAFMERMHDIIAKIASDAVRVAGS